jgi:hypothetical protein
MHSARQRFVDHVRRVPGARPVVSPFLPKPGLAPDICSKGNLSLGLLRDGSVQEVIEATREMVRAVQGHAHIHFTADAVYAETPAESYVAFVQTAREEPDRLARVG